MTPARRSTIAAARRAVLRSGRRLGRAGAAAAAPSRPPRSTVIDARRGRGAAARDGRRRAADDCRAMTVARNGGRGALTSVFPRGGESDYTLVLVDGIRVEQLRRRLRLQRCCRSATSTQVEIVRGPQSALFGADAIGGVVHLTTRQGGPPTVSAAVRRRQPGARCARAGRDARRVGHVVVRRRRRAQPERRLHGHRAGHRRDRVQRRLAAVAARRATSDWTQERRHGVRGTCGGSTPSAAIPGRTAATRSAPSPASTASRAATTPRSRSALHGRLPWGRVLPGPHAAALAVHRGRSRQPLSTARFGDSMLRDRGASTLRTQTDVAASPSTGLTARHRGARRTRAQHLRHRRAVPGGADRAAHLRRVRRGAAGPGRARDDHVPALRADAHPTRRARRRPERLRAATDVSRRRVGDLGEPAGGGASSRCGRTRAALRARRCAPAPARASARPTPSRSRSPTTRRLKPERSRSVDIGVSHVAA